MNRGFIGWPAAQRSPLFKRLVVGREIATPAASIVLDELPQGPGTLRIVCGQLRGDTAATSVEMRVRFNGDTGSNYAFNAIGGTTMNLTAQDHIFCGAPLAASGTAGYPAVSTIVIPEFGSATPYFKGALITTTEPTVTTGIYVVSGTWTSTLPITSVTIYPASGNWAVGGSFSVYIDP